RADVAHLARLDELLECAERLLDRRHAVGAVVLVQVDVLGTEALERAVDRAPHARRRAAGRIRPSPPAELRRDHDLLSRAGQRTADDALARAVAVHLGRVEDRPARVERRVHARDRTLLVEPQPEVVRAEPDDRYDEPRPADAALTHAYTFLATRW